MHRGIPVVVLLCLFGSRSEAGPHLRSEGEALFALRYEYSSANQYWDRHGTLRSLDCRARNQKLTGHYEYGYSYYRTLIVGAGVENASCGGDSDTEIDHLILGVRGRINPYRNDRAWELRAHIPMSGGSGITNDEFGLEAGMAGRDSFFRDTDEELYLGSIEYGASLRLWTGGESAQLLGYVQGDYLLAPSWALLVRFDAYYPLEGVGGEVATSENETGYKLLKGTFGLNYEFERKRWLSFGVFQDLWGENTNRRSGVFTGVTYVWR